VTDAVGGNGSHPPPPDHCLEVRSVNKRFGAQQVLFDVDVDVRPREVHALVGHNGSGKSTLVKILAGVHHPEPGAEIRVDTKRLRAGDPDDAYDLGLRFVHQDLGLVETLDVVDNVLFGTAYPRRSFGRIDWQTARAAVTAILDELGYALDVRSSIARLSLAERTGVALARAMYQPRGEPTVLVFDEPTAALPSAAVDHLFQAIRGVVAKGLGVLYISHRLDEIFRIADRVSVLRDGRVVAVENVADLDERRLIELMVGRHVERSARRPLAERSSGALQLRGIRTRRIRAFDLDVGAGEIVGVAGIAGSGRDELAGAIFGSVPRRGTVDVFGDRLPAGRTDRAIERGIGLLPSDRARNGLLHGMTVRENLSIADLPTRARGALLDRRQEQRDTSEWLDRLDVRPGDPERPVHQLSGGNQQKVLLARWLRRDPKVLILDEPTQGVDVATVGRLYSLVRAAAGRGTAVLVCSSDTDELVRLCDRIVVLVGGVQHVELTGTDISREAVDAAALAFAEGAAS